MKRQAAALAGLVVVLTACSEPTTPPPSGDTASPPTLSPSVAARVIPDRYIVRLRDDVRDVPVVAAAMARIAGGSVQFTYERTIRGFAAHIPRAALSRIASDPRVLAIEPDQEMSISAQTLPWGIDRVEADLSSTMAGNGSGAVSNVNVYIIDTGVDTKHADLNVVGHVNFVWGTNGDCHGHGTHVAGTVAARDNGQDVVGVAPGAPVTGVKVLDCFGSGSTSGVIRGVEWVTANAKTPAIANMSLGGGVSDALDAAVVASVGKGIFYAVAAGNDGVGTCASSPARAGSNEGVMTVAATDVNEAEASWSNYGSCVDIWAPGVSILSTKRRGGTTTMSGTSMASPHVGGGGALYLSNNTSAKPAAVEAAIKAVARATGTASKDSRPISRLDVATF